MTKHQRDTLHSREAMASRLTNAYRLRKLSAFRSSILISREAMAATLIQTAWRTKFRHNTNKALATKFLDPALGVPINWVKSLEGGFKMLVIELREQARIKVVKDCLMRIHYLSIKRHGNTDPSFMVNVRVFMSGYMIAYWQADVFENMNGALERALIQTTVPLMELVETMATYLAGNGSFLQMARDHTEGFQDLMKRFFADFKLWKVPDEAKLTKRIINALIALEQGVANLPSDEPQDSRLRTEMRAQIERLRGKLLQIGGASALADYDASQEPWRRSVQEQQEAATEGREGYEGVARYDTGKISNEQLAHELLLDPAFCLDQDGEGPFKDELHTVVRKTFHEKFWDSLADDVSLSPPCFVRCIRVIAEVRDGLIDCAGNAAMIAQINEVIDIDLIKQMAQQDIFDWEYFQRLVSSAVGVIRRIQDQARGEDLTSKWNELRITMEGASTGWSRIFSQALEFMLSRVSIIRIDLANNRLRHVAPIMLYHGIGYEHDKFQAKLTDGSLTLEHTTVWIRESVVRQAAIGTISIPDLVAGRSFKSLHTASILALIVSPVPIQYNLFPETLLMDRDRITWFRTEFNRIVDSSSVLVSVSYNLLGSTPTASKRMILLELSRLIVENVGKRFSVEDALSKFDEAIEYAGYTVPADDKSRICKALEASVGKEHPVRKLIADRITKAWAAYVNAPAPIGEAQFINAARILIPHIEERAAGLHKFISVNRNVHSATYNRLIAEAARAVSG